MKNPLENLINNIKKGIQILVDNSPSDFDTKMVLDQACKNSKFWCNNQTKQAMDLASEVQTMIKEQDEAREAGADHGFDTRIDFKSQQLDQKSEAVDYWTAYHAAACELYKAHEGEDWKDTTPAKKTIAKAGYEDRAAANLARFKTNE